MEGQRKRGGISDPLTRKEVKFMQHQINSQASAAATKHLLANRNAFDVGNMNENDYSFSVGGGTNKSANAGKKRILIQRADINKLNEHRFGKVSYPTVDEIFNGKSYQQPEVLLYDWENPNRNQSSATNQGVVDAVTPYGKTPAFFPEVEDEEYLLRQKAKKIKLSEKLYGGAGTEVKGKVIGQAGSGVVNYSIYSWADQPIYKQTGTPFMPYISNDRQEQAIMNQNAFATKWYQERVAAQNAVLNKQQKTLARELGAR